MCQTGHTILVKALTIAAFLVAAVLLTSGAAAMGNPAYAGINTSPGTWDFWDCSSYLVMRD